MKLFKLIQVSIAIFAVLAGVNICFSLLTAHANSEKVMAYGIKQGFTLAGHELRMASLELTRLARAFIVMGMEQQLEQYWEELLVLDRLGAIRQMFVDNEASPHEMDLLDRALAYQERLRAIDVKAFNARFAGDYQLALDITYGVTYSTTGATFVNTLNELTEATFARTQEMVVRAERDASFFERLTFITAILLGIVIVLGTILILSEVKAAMRREHEAVESERETSELTKTILDSAPFVISLWDDTRNIVVASRQAREMFEVDDPQEIAGERFYDFLPECQPCGTPSREKIRSHIDDAFWEGYTRFEWMHNTKSGDPLPVEVVVRRFDRKDNVMFVSYTTDIRKIKAAMEKEHEANVLNQMYLDASPMFIEIWDDQMNVIDCNDKVRDLFLLDDKTEFITRYSKFSPEYQPCGTRSMEKIMSMVAQTVEKGFVRFEWMHKRADGELLPVDSNYVKLKRDGKDIVVGYNYDLRPIKAAEGLTKKLLDNSPMFMEFWDLNGTMLDCNRKMLEIFKVNSKEEFKKHFFDFCPRYQPCGTPSPKKNEELIKYAMEKGIFRIEWMYLLPNGEEFPAETTWVLLMHQGEPMVIVYSQDLRLVKAAVKKEQQAEEENLAKTRFLAHMSHEIRTPMNAILGIAEIQLQKNGHPPETDEAFLRIHNSSRLLLNIVNDILDLSRVVAGKMEIILAPYGMASLVVDTVQLNHMHIGDKELKIKLDIDCQLPVSLIGDELRIKQILNNLLSNAIKYTVEGTVTMSLSMEATQEPEDVTLVVVVSDTGQGMTKEQLDILFGEFSRFNTPINRNIEGSGLGMPITYSLIKLMHGDINVESDPGRGTVFTVRLPQKSCSDEVLGEDVVANLHDMENYKVALRRKPRRIPELMPYGKVLVVDDVDINLYVVEGILESYEIAVETAMSGPEAISKIKNGGVYDIIFMDHMMPGMNGVEATRAIRDMGYDRPIVALTANALKDTEKMFMENGFSGFVSKPIDIDKLDMYLMSFIRNKRQE
ncbi:MAG: ATP-binding protein [Treponema sp.]|nr:ATP-binding protein [Treponema sp.]